MANMIARLGVVLGLDTAEFNKGIEAAGKKLEQFSQSAEKYGKVGATALVAASAAALQYADELADVAKANDVAIGTVLKLSNALGNAGGKANDTGKLLASFTKFIDEAAGGSLQAQTTAKMLGLSLQDLGKLSEEELLNKVIKNLGKMDDSVTRNAKAMDVFGKAAKGVDFVGLAEDMGKTNKLTDEQAIGIQKAADAYDMLAQNARDTMTVLAAELGPILKTTLDYMKDIKGEGNGLGQVFKTVFQTIAVLGANVAFVFKGIADEIQHTYDNAVTLVTKGVQAAIDANKKYDAYRASQRQNLDFYEAQVMGVSMGRSADDPRRTDNKSSAPAVGRKVTPAVDKDAARRLKEYLHELQKIGKFEYDSEMHQIREYINYSNNLEKQEQQLQLKMQMLDFDKQLLNVRAEDATLAKEYITINQKRADAIQEINRNNLLDEDSKKQLIARENELADATLRYAKAQRDAVQAQREGSFEKGFGDAMQRFFRDMPTELENGAKAFDSVMGNMESAINQFVQTGKISFKSLARSIIQDILAIQLKASATSIFKGLFGMGGGINTSGADLALFYADGGSPPVNQPAIVGERGPELFVPRTAGTIIPNHALAGMGGTTMVTNNYINAIDTKSFEERLYGSSNAIWAANQYANKSLAVNRGRA